MKRNLAFFTIAVLTFVLFSVSSCSKANSNKKDIIGKWIANDGDTLEFVEDGTVILVKSGMSLAGNYKFLPDGHLKMDVGGFFGSKVFEVSFDELGGLILKEPTGEASRYLIEKPNKAQLEAQRKAEEEIKSNFVFSDLTFLDKTNFLTKPLVMWTRDGNLAGKKMTWNDAFNFIKRLNEQKYAGYNDWRLPTKEELETLLNFVKSNGMGFINVQSAYYWSSSAGIYKNFVWAVHMWDGVVNGSKDGDVLYVWPVRSGQ